MILSRKLALIAVVATVGFIAHTAEAAPLRCDITRKLLCTKRYGCKPVPPTVWDYVDLGRHQIARCDGNGCDTYDALFSPSGIFTNIAAPERGLSAKVVNIGQTSEMMQNTEGDFLETVTMMNAVYLSFGRCKVQP